LRRSVNIDGIQIESASDADGLLSNRDSYRLVAFDIGTSDDAHQTETKTKSTEYGNKKVPYVSADTQP
jgi:hypothetical protein